MLLSIVKLSIMTEPVPPGTKRISAFELDPIILSLKVKLSMVTVPARVDVPVTVRFPKVASPSTVNVPVVVKFSLPKLISPPESVIDPFASVRFPIVDPDPAVIVPVVLKFSLPKLMAPEESVIDPSAIVRLPNVDPVAAVTVPVMVAAPDVAKVPSTMSPSLILIAEESSELKVVPFIAIDPKTTLPVPAGNKLMSSFVLNPSMLFPLNFIAGNTTAPEPEGAKTMSSLLLTALISLPVNVSVAELIPGEL